MAPQRSTYLPPHRRNPSSSGVEPLTPKPLPSTPLTSYVVPARRANAPARKPTATKATATKAGVWAPSKHPQVPAPASLVAQCHQAVDVNTVLINIEASAGGSSIKLSAALATRQDAAPDTAASATPSSTGAWRSAGTCQRHGHGQSQPTVTGGQGQSGPSSSFVTDGTRPGTWGPSKKPQVPALPIARSGKSGITWGPSKKPQVPGNGRACPGPCPSTIRARDARLAVGASATRAAFYANLRRATAAGKSGTSGTSGKSRYQTVQTVQTAQTAETTSSPAEKEKDQARRQHDLAVLRAMLAAIMGETEMGTAGSSPSSDDKQRILGLPSRLPPPRALDPRLPMPRPAFDMPLGPITSAWVAEPAPGPSPDAAPRRDVTG